MCVCVLLGSLAIFGGEIDTVPPGCANPTKKRSLKLKHSLGQLKKLGLSENGGYPPTKKKCAFKMGKIIGFWRILRHFYFPYIFYSMTIYDDRFLTYRTGSTACPAQQRGAAWNAGSAGLGLYQIDGS